MLETNATFRSRASLAANFIYDRNSPVREVKVQSPWGYGSSAVASKRAWSGIKLTASPEHGTTSLAALVDVTGAV